MHDDDAEGLIGQLPRREEVRLAHRQRRRFQALDTRFIAIWVLKSSRFIQVRNLAIDDPAESDLVSPCRVGDSK